MGSDHNVSGIANTKNKGNINIPNILKPNGHFYHIKRGIYDKNILNKLSIKAFYNISKCKNIMLDWLDSLNLDLIYREYDNLFKSKWLSKKRTRQTHSTVINESVVEGHCKILRFLNDNLRIRNSNKNLGGKGIARMEYQSNRKIKKKKNPLLPKKKKKKKKKK